MTSFPAIFMCGRLSSNTLKLSGLIQISYLKNIKKDIPNTYHDDVSEKISGLAMQRELPKSASKAAEWLPTVLVVIGVIIVIAIIYAIIQLGMSKSGQTDGDKAVTQSESKYEIPKDSALKNDGNTNDEAQSDSKKRQKRTQKRQSRKRKKKAVKRRRSKRPERKARLLHTTSPGQISISLN